MGLKRDLVRKKGVIDKWKVSNSPLPPHPSLFFHNLLIPKNSQITYKKPQFSPTIKKFPQKLTQNPQFWNPNKIPKIMNIIIPASNKFFNSLLNQIEKTHDSHNYQETHLEIEELSPISISIESFCRNDYGSDWYNNDLTTKEF